MKGNLVIIASPSGGGKGTLIREILSTMPEIRFSVSYTTRSKRSGEQDGREYFFISRDDFEKRLEDGEFLESATVHGNLYGTSRTQLAEITDAGTDVILEIDVQGAMTIIEKQPEIVSIFILPPSFTVLSDRLRNRATESPEEIDLRLKNAVWEVSKYEKFKYLVVNEVLSSAADEIRTIIRAERLRTIRRKNDLSDILIGFDRAMSSSIGE